MFSDLFERVFRLDEGEKTIRAIYKVYKDLERRLDPEISDLDDALEGLEKYYRNYIRWWKVGYGKDEPVMLKVAYSKRLKEIQDAQRSNILQNKIIALDNAINQWHIDYPIIAHLEMEAETENEEMAEGLDQLVGDIMEILRRLGKFPEESPYMRR